MAQITARELYWLGKVLSYEEACYEKFSHYAREADDTATQKLCAQLADRSREHYTALLGQFDASTGRAH
jgi:hypothetical protein